MEQEQIYTPSAVSSESMRQRFARFGLVVVIVTAILGTAWIIGERQNFGSIGSGGVNAQLLPKVGEPAPEFFTLYADGQPMLLSALKGQPVWINFWGSWCQPCRAEMPELIAAYEILAPQGITMLAISLQETPSDAVSYAQLVGAPFPILIDPGYMTQFLEGSANPELVKLAESPRSWQVNNFPTHIFIDQDGIVRAVVIEPLTVEKAVAYGEMILGND
jgi:thiol-disulfide isomerase/thioredoxin